MAGSVIITGANGSLAIPAVTHLLTNYPDLTLILTVRNASSTDINTNRLKDTITQFPNAHTSIHELDLATLPAVHKFADHVVASIKQGTYPPLRSIIANAFYWNLVGPAQTTEDGYEKTFQINHIAHAALILRLLGSFGKTDNGRIVLFSSDAHCPGRNVLEKSPPGLPEDLELLVQPNPAAAAAADNAGQGFQRYANSKLAIVSFMHALNRHLEKEPASINNVTAVAVEPGDLSDSRALRTNTPQHLQVIQRLVLQPLRPVLAFANPRLRTSARAAVDIVELAVGQDYRGAKGYFYSLVAGESSPESRDLNKQEKLWAKTVEWAGITQDNCVLGGSSATGGKEK